MSFFENWIEADLNPIVTFSNNGKILYSNNEAQFLLNRVSSKEIFDLALKYAPMSYGLETKFINITLSKYVFYAVTVSYENEESISIKLYKSISAKTNTKKNINKGEQTNIFTLIDLAISTQKIKSNINFQKSYDPSIPEFRISMNSFLKLLNELYASFDNAKDISTTVKLKTGEYIRIEDKKYALITISISTTTGYFTKSYEDFTKLVNNSHIVLTIKEENVSIDLPLFLD